MRAKLIGAVSVLRGKKMQAQEIVVFKLHRDFFKAFSPQVPQRLEKYLGMKSLLIIKTIKLNKILKFYSVF